VFSDATLAGMLTTAALLLLALGWPIWREMRHWIVCRRLRRRIHQDHVDWIARRAAHMREVLR